MVFTVWTERYDKLCKLLSGKIFPVDILIVKVTCHCNKTHEAISSNAMKMIIIYLKKVAILVYRVYSQNCYEGQLLLRKAVGIFICIFVYAIL